MRFGSVCSGIEAASVILKKCAKCGEVKGLECYHKQPSGQHGRHSYCKPCANKKQKESRTRNYTPEAKRRWQLKTRYGMTPQDVQAMLDKQGCACAICAKKLTDKYHIDHDHQTGAVRGILCHGCNIRIGGWDKPGWLAAALQYMGVTA
jgi:hypothetical protein